MKTRAFTLIEMLVVIAIITLLTAIVVTGLTGSKSKARDAKRISDIGNIQLALELFFDRCKQYPTIPLSIDQQYSDCPNGITLKSFISVLPTAPSPGSYNYAILEDDTSGYAVDYVLNTQLESSSEIVKDGFSPYPPYSAPVGFTWLKVNSATISCSNAPTSKDYCIGPK